ncbi:hypothetical protein VTJ49DRAFT_5206 [Mycothermus thermophilus]|uniref:TauD/TfdA-like domain-containing protein n=1 Tax=Humicola insolens TaxID=85995 RepID=A0ABR3VKQ8_HUMIN
MGVETVLLEEQPQVWRNLAVKADRAADHFPITHTWPAKLEGPLVWRPDSFVSEDDYTLALTEDEIAEVRAGLKHFKNLDLYGSEVSPETFPLSTLGPKLRGLALEIHRGRGFAVIRGLDPDEFSPEDNVLIFLGVSSYIGELRGRQDEHGSMLMHIRNASHSQTPQQDRPTRYSSRPSTFHTDTFADILALHTLRPSLHGGRNLLSSASTIYNTLSLQPHHRRLIELLAQPCWSFDSRGSFLPSSTRPLLHYHQGRVMLNFAREPILGLPGVKRAEGLAEATASQRRALDVVEETAKQNQVVLEARKGDMLFVNNHAVLHSREGFEDHGGDGRYLVRMWLRNGELKWDLPEGALKEGNERIYGRDGGRDHEDELGEVWNVVDVPRVAFELSERLTS